MRKKELLKKLHHANMVTINARAELIAWKQTQPERDKELLELRNNVRFWRENSRCWEGVCRDLQNGQNVKQEKSSISEER